MAHRDRTPIGAIERLRQPEYTGENRCIPCTAVNLVIAGVVAVALAVLVPALGPLVGAGAFLAFAGVIYFRGYLVPYTPTLTKRYFPDRVLAWFDKAPEERTGTEAPDVDPEEVLRSVGAVEECREGTDLCLTDSFRRAWREEMTGLDDDGAREERIADLLDLEGDGDHEIRQFGHSAAAVAVDGTQVGQWESDAAFVADLAADRVLRDRMDGWTALDLETRSELLGSLRIFLERCPDCDGPVTMGQETVESCCRSREVIAVGCESCGDRLFEATLTDQLQAEL